MTCFLQLVVGCAERWSIHFELAVRIFAVVKLHIKVFLLIVLKNLLLIGFTANCCSRDFGLLCPQSTIDLFLLLFLLQFRCGIVLLLLARQVFELVLEKVKPAPTNALLLLLVISSLLLLLLLVSSSTGIKLSFHIINIIVILEIINK